jgi:hypothetical protein
VVDPMHAAGPVRANGLTVACRKSQAESRGRPRARLLST